jgi:hypothetical protein
MRTSSLDERSSGTAAPPVKVRRRSRPRVIIATAALTLLAVATGSGIALTTQRQPAATPTNLPITTVAVTPVVSTGAPAGAPTASGGPTAGAKGGATSVQAGTASAPVDGAPLINGTYNAFIRKIDPDRRTMLVDVIQVFAGQAAEKAAAEDSRSASFVEMVRGSGTYIRNSSPRLRPVPVATSATIKFLNTCEGPTATRHVLTVLAKNATTSEGFYYTLTMSDGSVTRIVEHQSQPAC